MYKVSDPTKQFTTYDPKVTPQFTLRNSPEEFMGLMAAIAPNSTEHEEQRLLAFYKWVDVVTLELRAASVCEKGCAHCCKHPVSVTPLEIDLAKFSPNFFKAAKFDPTTGYCPFLSQESAQCTIYELRPLACRVFLALDDPSYCSSNETHFIFTMDQLMARLPELLAPGQDLYQYWATKINTLFEGERTDFRMCSHA